MTAVADGGFVLKLAGKRSIRAARLIDQVTGHLRLARPTVMVSGFWRSGTTWLQEYLATSLDARTVFEPLAPQNRTRGRMLEQAGFTDAHHREAYIPGRAAAEDPMWSYLDRTFRGLTTSNELLMARSSLRQSFRRLVVMKDVRLQMNLDAVHHRYQVPIIHIRRHPCAVVSSVIAARFWWSFDNVRLADLVRPFEQELRQGGLWAKLDDKALDADGISRIATYWAITESFVDKAVENQPWALIIPYEQAVLAPSISLKSVFGLIGRAPRRSDEIVVDSISTRASLRGTDVSLRPKAWQTRLSPRDIGRILDIARLFYPKSGYGLAGETTIGA